MRRLDARSDAISIAPAFDELAPNVRDQLAACSERVEVRAGAVVIRRDEPGDCCYVVRSGLLEVLDADEVQRERVLRAGALFGELSLLASRPRSATVRAVRDSELLRVPRAAFDALLAHDAGFARTMVQALTTLVFESHVERDVEHAPRVFGLAALHDDVPLDAVIDAFVSLLGPVAVRDALHEPETGWGRAVEDLERSHANVLLVARRRSGAWFDFCVREADRVVAVGDLERELPVFRPVVAPDLLLVGRSRTGAVARALRAVPARAHHLAASAADAPALARAGRRAAGRSIGVVLSGGGARGLAHVGVLAALADAGIEVDRYGGTSMGALVGALAARGCSWGEVEATLRAELVGRRPFADWTVPRVSLIRGRRARDMLERVCGPGMIEELPRDFFCVSADLVAADTVVHRRGPLVAAVGASMSLPGLAPPIHDGERLLIDGGILDNLPIAEMAVRDEGPVVAVDVIARGMPGAKRGAGRLPSIVETIARSVSLAGRRRGEQEHVLADRTIVPDLRSFGLLDFARFDAIVEAGRRAAHAALAAAPLRDR